MGKSRKERRKNSWCGVEGLCLGMSALRALRVWSDGHVVDIPSRGRFHLS